MAESNYVDETRQGATTQQQNQEKFPSVVRRKLERFRTKLAELFFAPSLPSKPLALVNSLPNNHNNQSIATDSDNTNNSNLIISNCYYGYTSPPITEEDLRISCKKKSKINKLHATTTSSASSSGSTSSSACSSSSSMIIEDDSHSTFSNFTSQPQTGELILSQFPVDSDNSHITLPHSLTTGVITLNRNHHVNHNQQVVSNLDYYSFNSQLNAQNSHYDTSSLNTNEEENPFLNKRLTDQIHFNSDLTQLNSYFEAALDLIDDQDNFFNIEFMTNYIAYILLKQLNEQTRWDLKLTPNQDRNLLIEIAEQIFLESRDEPCGLKGCNISVFVRGEENESETLVSKFQFGTSRFGAFDINLFLKQSDQVIQQPSAIATLTRRIFNMNTTTNNKLASNKANNNNTKQYNDNARLFYLDSNSYDLFKTNLAYE